MKWRLCDERIQGFSDAKIGNLVRQWVGANQAVSLEFLNRTNTISPCPDDPEILCYALLNLAVAGLIIQALTPPKK